MKRFWKDNGLSLVLFAFFLAALLGQSLAGYAVELHELQTHGQPSIPFADYLRSGDFVEVTMENWESEFFQMFVYVVFTVFLFQRGSAESKSPDESSDVDRDPRLRANLDDVPGPVKRGGWRLKLYENSLSLTFLALFLVSFLLHAAGGVRAYNEQLHQHGEPALTFADYLFSSQFWFESLQNWQSEFLAIWSMVVLSIFLRQRGSPESKPVDAPHAQTGSD
ncbi:DUF6766 family protein [Povalibacter sp.]|uniref:DUF6766 family protein n=1 Tax=Povalibacter sp. TaxID=1962978 RepID=UPI002F40AD97